MTRKESELIELINLLRTEFFRRSQNTVLPRQVAVPLLPQKIISIIGMRRTGKSSFQMQIIKNLLSQGVSYNQIFYMNFEDDRLLPLNGKELGEMIDVFYKLYPENHHRIVYFFFDEIQNINEWSKTIRRVYDSKKAQIVITGSSAKLLSKEIDTSLRGRALSQEIYPLSFSEWLDFRNICYHEKDPSSEAFLQRDFEIYLREGGFPELFFLPVEKHIETLQNYAHVTVLKDIVERHNVSNDTALRYLIKLLLNNSGRLISTHKVYNDLKSQGIRISKDSIYEYINYLEDAFFIFTVPLFAESIRKQQSNPKKVYSIDNGITRAYLTQISANFGSRFENQIFLDLKRSGYTVHYYKTGSGHEIDFLVQKQLAPIRAFQVSTDMLSDLDLNVQEARKELRKELDVEVEYVHLGNYQKFLKGIQ